jgi:hypothetical protein
VTVINCIAGSISCCNLKNCIKSTSRKQCLREVLTLLQAMERKRLYNPPADDEIQHYIRIKRHIRSLIIFFDARVGHQPDTLIGYRFCPRTLDFLCRYADLRSLLEIVELGWHFADLSTYVSDMDIRKGKCCLCICVCVSIYTYS